MKRPILCFAAALLAIGSFGASTVTAQQAAADSVSLEHGAPYSPALLANATVFQAAAAQAEGGHWTTLRIAKWSILAGAATSAVYGFVRSRAADDQYGQLERACNEEPQRCLDTTPSGAYADPALESQYQRVLHLDRQARFGLITSQLAVATSVVLFLLDLRNARPPETVPYEPSTLQVGSDGDGRLTLRFSLPLPR